MNSKPDFKKETTAPTHLASSIPLAVVGIGCLFPKAADKSTYWANIKNKVDAISEVPETHWRTSDYYDPDPKRADHTYGKRGGFLDPVDFNPLEFNIQPNILEAIDTSQLLGLIAAREALRDAGYDPAGDFARDRVSVLLGVTGALEMVIPLGARLGHPIWRKALLDSGIPGAVADEVVERISASYVPWQENSFPGLLGNVVAGRISKQFNLGGSNSVVDAACGSSLSAVHMAAMELACGHADMVITGGIDTFNDIFMYTCFSKTPALSPTNQIRPFDEASDGTMIGEGLGLVTLKRLEDAERDGNHIYAIIKSVGSGSDGKGGAIYEPSVNGQKRTLLNAQKLAGVEPRDITLIEAHGTGTKVGDATEIKALREVFGDSDGTPWCALGSVKSQIGHAKAAAGAAGLIKTVLALHNKIIPPTINVDCPQDIITAGNSPFYVNTEARPWVTEANKPRRAGVSAFGFGGSNFHCILEEYQHEKRFCDWDGSPQIMAWSAASLEGLKQQLEQSQVDLQKNSATAPSTEHVRQLAARNRTAFDPGAKHRLVCCIEESAHALATLGQAHTLLESGKDQASTPTGIYYSAVEPIGADASKVAVLFPGQGAQYPFMLRDLACHAPEMLEELERADATLELEQGQKLSDLIYPHSVYTNDDKDAAAQKLQATQHAQPAIGAVSFGAWRYLQRYGIKAGVFGGHSYGELTALCAAHCYTPAELYRLSGLRGTLMRGDGSDKGTMLAVSAPLADIEALLKSEGLDLIVANKNTPQQGVLSGARAEIERAATACKNAGMRCIPLDVAAAFHSKLVAAASEPFHAGLDAIAVQAPDAKVYANKTGSTYPSEPDAIRTLLAQQIASPVEFVHQIEQMHADGITTFIEVGPGARLSGMVKKILPSAAQVHIVTLDSSNGKRAGMLDVARALAQLAALGLPLELQRWDEDYAQTYLSRPAVEDKKPRMSIKICGANSTKEREPIPPSTRTLVDSREIHCTPCPSASGQQTSQTQPQPQHTTAPSLQVLRSQMSVLQQMQEDTARLHEQFLAGQTEALQAMRNLMGQQVDAPVESSGSWKQASDQQANPPTPVISQQVAPRAPQSSVTRTQTTANPGANAQAHAQSPSSQHQSAQPAIDIAGELLRIVAEKTGYPTEMLELDMSLDADLGIDSIKRVEILAAVQEQLPELPGVEPQQLSSLQTLRQIVETLSSAAAELSSAPQALSATSAATNITAANIDVAAELLRIVAEKTGYPTEMLELDMSLDADLGIDSIKRVEILAAVQEQLPELPGVEPQQLSSLQTLRQIVETLSSAAAESSSATTTNIANIDVAAELLRIVAEKTGYPTEMLELDMSLDADLGIDSIKRVEILAAVQEQLPELPGVEPQQLSSLQTLRQIVETLEAQAPNEATTPPTAACAQCTPTTRSVPAAGGTGIQRQIVRTSTIKQERTPLNIQDPIMVVDDASPLTEDLVNALLEAGYAAKSISPNCTEVPQRLGGLLIPAPGMGTDSNFIRDAFTLLQRCAPALHAAAANAGAVFITLSRLDGSFGFAPDSILQDPISGGLAGLSKTAGHEWPDITCRALDLDPLMPPEEQIRHIVYEIGHSGPPEVGIACGGVCTLELQDEALPAQIPELNLSSTDVVVISGGGRGVTAAVALQLAQTASPTLLLLGRSAVPKTEKPWLANATTAAQVKQAVLTNTKAKLSPKELNARCERVLNQRELRCTIEQLEQAGSRVIYRALDIRDEKAVGAAINEARQNGTIRGIIHGAGVLADKAIADKTTEQFELVYSTKIRGLQALLQATADDDLAFIALFSSSTGRFGRTGQIDYAAANEVMNKTAQALARQRQQCRVVSLNWGPWDGGMVTPGLKKLFASEGISVIDLDAGSRYLLRELASPSKQVELVILGGDTPAPEKQHSTTTPPTQSAPLGQLPEKVLQIPVSCAHIPCLRDHVIAARAVVPMALSAEWLALGAMHSFPGLTFYGFDQLRICRGITLEQTATCQVELRCGQMQPATAEPGTYVVPMQVCDADSGMIYSSAEVILADARPATAPSPFVLSLSNELQEDKKSIYADTRLFHGPALQGLEQVLGLSAEGISALARNTATPASWMQTPLRHNWLSAPMLLDSSFQLMILWCFARQQCVSLPSYIRHYRQYVDTVPAQELTQINCLIRNSSASMVQADIDFITPDSSQLLARIEGYECTMTDNLGGAFACNTLA